MYKYHRLQDTIRFQEIVQILLQKKDAHQITEQLSSYFQKIFGFTKFILTGSGRQAILLALNQANEDKNEVITPAYGCPIVPRTIIAANKTPIFADIVPETFAPSFETIKGLITKKTAAVMLVHEFGNLVNHGLINQLRDYYDGIIIEDAAIALGGVHKDGTRVGKASDFTIFSGGLGKPVSACAWGGLGVNSEGKYQHEPVSIQDNGSLNTLLTAFLYSFMQNPILFNLTLPLINWRTRTGSSIQKKITHPSIIDDLLMQNALNKNDRDIEKIHEFGMDFIGLLEEMNFTPIKIESKTHQFSRIPFYTRNKEECKSIIQFFGKHGIELSRPHQQNFAGASNTRYPNAFKATEQLVCFTIKRTISQGFQNAFKKTLSEFMNNCSLNKKNK